MSRTAATPTVDAPSTTPDTAPWSLLSDDLARLDPARHARLTAELTKLVAEIKDGYHSIEDPEIDEETNLMRLTYYAHAARALSDTSTQLHGDADALCYFSCQTAVRSRALLK